MRRVRLRDLQPWPRNPRRISDQQKARLLESFDAFGQVDVLAIGPAVNGLHPVYNGHQRLSTLVEKHGLDFEVDARISSRALTEKERERLTIYLHRGATGEFDIELLTEFAFDPSELDSWGMPDLNVPDVPEAEWTGMPEFDGSAKAFAQVIVRFDDEQSVAAFAQLVQQTVTKETSSIWFPPQQRVVESAQQWSSDEP